MKGKKIIVPLLLAGVTATGFVANIQQQSTGVHAETVSEISNINGAELQVKPFAQDKYSIGDKVYMPDCAVVGGLGSANYEYSVKKGNKSVKVLTDSENKKYFVADYVGYYNVSISVVENGKVVSTVEGLSVWVEKEEATINLPINSEYVIPAKVPTKQDGLKIPAPTVTTVVNGEDVEKKINEFASGTSMRVYLNTPTSDKNLTLDSTNSYYLVNKDDLAEAGTYTIVYEYKIGDSVISRLESNFQVVSDYDTSKIKLAMSFLDSMPSSGNVNTDISIPKVKVIDTNSSSTDAINANVKIVVKNVRTGATVDVDYDNYTFCPTDEGFYSVTYVASVPVFGDTCKTGEITPGNIIEVSDKQSPKIIPTYDYDIEDGEISVVYNNGAIGTDIHEDIANDKTAREVAEELLVNRKVDIPSVAVLKKDAEGNKFVNVNIPAAYATDNFYTYKGGNTDDITITRSYRTSTGSVVTLKESEFPANKEATITFKTKGNSEIRYKATDKAGNTLGEVVYDIVIYDVDEDLSDGVTKIDLNVGTKLVSEKEKVLTFAKPTASDTYDSNVEVRTFYTITGTTLDPIELTETNEDGKYEIDIEKIANENATATGLNIYAEAYVDSTLIGTRGTASDSQLKDSNKVVSDVYEVTILRTNADTVCAQFGIVGAGTWNEELFEVNNDVENGIIVKEHGDDTLNSVAIDDAGYLLVNNDTTNQRYNIGTSSNPIYLSAFNQGSDILTIPDVKFTDGDSNLTISVSIKDKFGNVVSKSTQETITRNELSSEYEYIISGAQFKLSTYGVYTVTFTAQDYAGNTTVKTYGIRVNDKTAPTITIDDEDKFGSEIEVGEYFNVPTARLVKNGETVNGSITWGITYASTDKYSKQPNGFTPLDEGTFIISYSAIDEYGNTATLEDSMFTITAKDTIAPTLELDMTYRMPTSKEWAPATGDDYMIIDIPVAIATDELTKKDLEVVYTVTGPNSSKPIVNDYEESENKDYVKYFKATTEGKYTIKYSAIDEAGNEKTLTKTIAIGDCVSPTLSWVDKDKDLPTEIELGKNYTLDLNSMIKLSDNKDTKAELLENISITLTGPDGTTVSNNLADGTGYEWTFAKSGNYTLKFVVEDKVGNSETYTYSINVPSEEAEEKKVSPVLGTVLVVLSVVVLAGVVVYFVASSKKKNSKPKAKKTK